MRRALSGKVPCGGERPEKQRMFRRIDIVRRNIARYNHIITMLEITELTLHGIVKTICHDAIMARACTRSMERPYHQFRGAGQDKVRRAKAADAQPCPAPGSPFPFCAGALIRRVPFCPRWEGLEQRRAPKTCDARVLQTDPVPKRVGVFRTLRRTGHRQR